MGLFISSLLLTITQGLGSELPKEEIERRAREIGMVYREEVLAFSEANQVAQEAAEEANLTYGQGLSPPEETAEEPVGDNEIKVVIPSGLTSEEVARILKDKGVINSERDFLRSVAKKNVTYKLKAGTFTFPKGATLDQVITTLTN